MADSTPNQPRTAPVKPLAAELFAAVQALRKEPKMPDAWARVVIDWFLSCHGELSRVGQPAGMWGLDPMELVDEPDSVSRAIALAREITGSGR